MARGTRPTQIRLTEDDKRMIREIRERYRLPSTAAAVRHALGVASRKTAGKKSEATP